MACKKPAGIALVIKSVPKSFNVPKAVGASGCGSTSVSVWGMLGLTGVSFDVSNCPTSVVKNSVNNCLLGYLSWYWSYSLLIKSSSLNSKKLLFSLEYHKEYTERLERKIKELEKKLEDKD